MTQVTHDGGYTVDSEGAPLCWNTDDGGVHRCIRRLGHLGPHEWERQNAMDKIRRKTAPKDYKRGPGPTGAARLVRSLHSLQLRAGRLARKEAGTTTGDWAEMVMRVLGTVAAAAPDATTDNGGVHTGGDR